MLRCSGLPPASSLFTDSEASSEAEEDKAAYDSRHPQNLSTVDSQGTSQAQVLAAGRDILQQSQQQQRVPSAAKLVKSESASAPIHQVTAHSS